ncbi:MAG: ABC transporter substrate-binding protein [Bacillota bacterium]
MKKIIALTLILTLLFSFAGCGDTSEAEDVTTPNQEYSEKVTTAMQGIDIEFESETPLEYAENFAIFNLEGGSVLLATYENSIMEARILVLSDGALAPSDLPSDVIVFDEPLYDVFIASSPVMSLTNALGKVSSVNLTTSTTWYIDEVNQALDNGDMINIGSSSSPDYELIAANMPNLAIFSGGLDTLPDTYTQLAELGMKYISDKSPYESTPLGRTEWLKFFGILYDEYDLACELFDEQVEIVAEVENSISQIADDDKKTVLFFYVSSSGAIYVRNEDDYLSNAIKIAGGEVLFTLDGSVGTSSISVTEEVFYALAAHADVIIYNYSMGGKPTCADDIINNRGLEMLSDFKAYQDGTIWATSQDFYQITDTIGQMIGDIHTAIYDENADSNLTYLQRLS